MTRGWLALLLLATPAVAQQPQTAVVPQTITVGDVFRAAVRVPLSPGDRLIPPDSIRPGADLEQAGGVEMVVDTVDGTPRATASWPLRAWRPGSYTLPTVRVTITGDGVDRTLTATLPAFEVRSVLPADTTGVEPKPAKDVLGESRVWWPWLLGLLILLLAAAALWWWRRRRKRAEDVDELPAILPREDALERLRALRDDALLAAGDYRAWYTRLSRILRRYAESAYPELGPDLTTGELAGRARRTVELTDALELVRILGSADLAKFARAVPAAGAPHSDLDAAIAWVERVPPAVTEPIADDEPERAA